MIDHGVSVMPGGEGGLERCRGGGGWGARQKQRLVAVTVGKGYGILVGKVSQSSGGWSSVSREECSCCFLGCCAAVVTVVGHACGGEVRGRNTH